MSRFPRRAAIAAALLLCRAPFAHAQWTRNGVPVCSAVGDQIQACLVSDGAGGAFVFWSDTRNGLGENDLYAQHLMASGTLDPAWPPDGRVVCAAASAQYAPHAVSDGAGGALVAWHDNRNSTYASPDVFAQRVTAAGTLAWSAAGLSVANGLFLLGPNVAPDGSGGMLVAYCVPRFIAAGTISVQRVFPQGVIAWGGGRSLARVDSSASPPVVVPDGAGGAIGVWADGRGPGLGSSVFARRVLSNGSVQWTTNGVAVADTVAPGGSTQYGYDAAPDGSNGVFVAFVDTRSGSPGLYLQRLGAGGAIVGGWPAKGLALGDAASGSRVVADGAGGVYVATAGRVWRVRGDGSMAPSWPAAGVSWTLAPGAEAFRLVADGTGGVFVAWEQRDNGVDHDIHAVRLLDGAVAPGWTEAGLAVTQLEGEQYLTDAVSNGSGGLISVWQDNRPGFGFGTDVFAALVANDGTVDALASLGLVTTRADLVHVEWWIGSSGSARVERSDGDSWRDRGLVLADGTGRVVWEDADVIAGGRYGYRLRLGDRLAGEVWVDVPPAGRLSLSRRANPADDLRVSLTLPRGRTALVEAFDVTGRCVVRRRVAGDGSQELRLDDAGRLAPGLYVVRATAGADRATLRCLVAR